MMLTEKYTVTKKNIFQLQKLYTWVLLSHKVSNIAQRSTAVSEFHKVTMNEHVTDTILKVYLITWSQGNKYTLSTENRTRT